MSKSDQGNDKHDRTRRTMVRCYMPMASCCSMALVLLLTWCCTAVSGVSKRATEANEGATPAAPAKSLDSTGVGRHLSDFFQKDQVPADRIIGGLAARRGRYPFFARQRNRRSSGSFRYACGGTLIAPQYVLTAAHCVANFTLDRTTNATVEHASTLRQDLWGFTVGYYCSRDRNCEQPSVDVEVAEWFLHPNYYRSSVWWLNDLAIARLARPMEDERLLRSIPLLDTGFIIENRNVAHQQNLTLIGSGFTNDRGKVPKTLQQQTVHYVNTTECESRWGLKRGTMRDDVFCTQVAGGGVCFGDSGGPIVYEGIDYVVLVGIPSGIFAASCQDKEGVPDIEGRIADPFKLGWIQSVVCANEASRGTVLCDVVARLAAAPKRTREEEEEAETQTRSRCLESPNATFFRKPKQVEDPRIQKCSWLVTRERIKRYCLKKRFGAKKNCKVSCGICVPL